MDTRTSINLSNFDNHENDSTVSPDLSFEFKVTKITFYALIFLMSIVGNVLVIFVISVDKRMRSSSHIFILHLAICDLLTPTISIPFDLAYEELQYAWSFGDAMCTILWPCQTFLTTSSALLLTAICIDRYRALVYPFKLRWTGKRLVIMVSSIFAFVAVMVVPYMLVLNVDIIAGRADCAEKWPNPTTVYRQAYTMVLFLFQYGLPLVIMVILYSIALYSLFRSTKKCFNTADASAALKIHRKSKDGNSPLKKQTLLELRREQHLKVTKMFIIVVIVFAVSMFPNQVLWLWVDYGQFTNNKKFPITAIICRLFTYSNSVLNPFIYGLYSKEFRSGYLRAGKNISGMSPANTKSNDRKRSEVTSKTIYVETPLITVNSAVSHSKTLHNGKNKNNRLELNSSGKQKKMACNIGQDPEDLDMIPEKDRPRSLPLKKKGFEDCKSDTTGAEIITEEENKGECVTNWVYLIEEGTVTGPIDGRHSSPSGNNAVKRNANKMEEVDGTIVMTEINNHLTDNHGVNYRASGSDNIIQLIQYFDDLEESNC